MQTPAAGSTGLKSRIRYDAVLKDLFQREHPLLLGVFTGGVRILETLNIEFVAVDERRPDLVFLMADGSVLHLEFQSSNDGAMVYRMGRYCSMIAERDRGRTIRQIVLYTGMERLRMAASADLGLTKLAYELHDIREFESRDFLRTGRPGDCALALLAAHGEENIGRILRIATGLKPHARAKLLTRLTVLCRLAQTGCQVQKWRWKLWAARFM